MMHGRGGGLGACGVARSGRRDRIPRRWRWLKREHVHIAVTRKGVQHIEVAGREPRQSEQ
jgi:hypothetical protein